MSTNTIIQQGRFTSTGSSVLIPLRSGVNWMNVYNVTRINDGNTGESGQFYWQEGMDYSYGIAYPFGSSTSAFPAYVAFTFTKVDTSLNTTGTVNSTITAVSTASIPVATNSGTNGLSAGSIVRLINVAGAQQLGGMDFTVGYNTLSSTTFSLDYMSQLGGAGTTGSWMLINYDPIFYPRRRFITKITKASQAVVTMSVTHGYKVGQLVRMVVPAAFGMTQMDGLQATIVAVNTTTTSGNSITLNIDSSSFTTFAFPVTAAVPFTYAEVVPMGEDTAAALVAGVDILSDATVNTAQIGLVLSAGTLAPAGLASDVIFWTAGTSFSVDNQ